VKVGEEAVGGRTRVKLAKNKCAPPFQEAEFEIRWGHGIDELGELLDLGVARGLVDRSGNHLAFAGSPLGNGRERARETLAASAELRSTLRQAILASSGTRAGRRAEAEA
jgi:recombination protein RecA